MVVRHNDTRRRRIVIEPTIQVADVGESVSEQRSTRRKTSLYRAGAERRNQWKTTDLLPKRTKAIVLLASGLVLIVLALNLLSAYSSSWTTVLSPDSIATLQLSGTATLATWFSSFLLIVSGFASLQIYALRQHRQDDYRGSYRLWLWMAALLMFGSVHCVVDLSSIVRDALQAFEFSSFAGKSLSLMILFKIGLLIALVVRGCFEVRESRSSLVLVVLVWFAYFSSMILKLPLVQPVIANVDPEIQQATIGNLLLLGSVFTFLATTLFARFVYMQALGLVKQRKRKSQKGQARSTVGKTKATRTRKTKNASGSSVKEKSKPSKMADTDESAIKINASSSNMTKSSNGQTENARLETAKPLLLKPTQGKSIDRNSNEVLRTASQEDGDQDQDDNDNILRLSKSERKKMKQKASQNRRAA